MQTIAPVALYAKIEQGESIDLVDVRTPVEFDGEHILSARSAPLESLDPVQFTAGRISGRPCYAICKTGARAKSAVEKLEAAGIEELVIVEGGIDAWTEAGLPLLRGETRVISLERQVRIAAGSLVLLGGLLGLLVHPAFTGIALFVGAGLVFAGVTNTCGMGMLLARMPWNQAPRSTRCRRVEAD